MVARLAWATCACTLLAVLVIAPSAGSAFSAAPAHRAGIREMVAHRWKHRVVARDPSARSSIVNGTQIAITQAPWQVAVIGLYEGYEFICGGSIIDSTHILTAAHCAYDEMTGERIPSEDFFVLAGTARISPKGFAEEPAGQQDFVSAIRVHPYYIPTEALPAADDVAMLTLETTLSETAAVQPIALSPAGVGPGEGTTVNLTGFGEESVSPPVLNRNLYSIPMSTSFRFRCGGESDALYVCASTPAGSLCSGDSGGALTLPGSTNTIAAVVNTVQIIEGLPCRDGAVGGFANVAAPELREFILGSESPPRAPRGGGEITIRGVTQVGNSLTCEAGSWSNSPSFTYTFIDSASGSPLQSGQAQTYALTAADVARAILCEVQAANAGGTGAVRTVALPAISAAVSRPSTTSETGSSTETTMQSTSPAPVATLPQTVTPTNESSAGAPSRISLNGTTLSVQKNGTGIVKLACVGTGACAGRISLTVRHTVKVDGRRTVRTVSVIPVKSFSIVEGGHADLTIKLSALARTLLSAAHGHLSAHLALVQLQPAPSLQMIKPVELSRAKSS